jgi:hypothetical protein
MTDDGVGSISILLKKLKTKEVDGSSPPLFCGE